jgi:pimeloyl-ACP methyl ester carboxylesterase
VRNVRTYGGDPERVVLMGHSAGGHLALLTVQWLHLHPDWRPDLDRATIRGIVGYACPPVVGPGNRARGQGQAVRYRPNPLYVCALPTCRAAAAAVGWRAFMISRTTTCTRAGVASRSCRAWAAHCVRTQQRARPAMRPCSAAPSHTHTHRPSSRIVHLLAHAACARPVVRGGGELSAYLHRAWHSGQSPRVALPRHGNRGAALT